MSRPTAQQIAALVQAPVERPAAGERSRSELQLLRVRLQPLGYAAASRSGLGAARLVAAARLRHALDRAADAAQAPGGGVPCKLARSAS